MSSQGPLKYVELNPLHVGEEVKEEVLINYQVYNIKETIFAYFFILTCTTIE